MSDYFLLSNVPADQVLKKAGGKAAHLAKMSQLGLQVPEWFCLTQQALNLFLAENKIDLKNILTGNFKEDSENIERLFCRAQIPKSLAQDLQAILSRLKISFFAVRSSGLDEDGTDHSFAGQFSTFLFQKTWEQIELSIKKCWASAYSERALSYRREKGLALEQIQMGVVIQKMVNAEVSGVAFSKNPLRPLDRQTVIVDAVWGLGEGLVSGELDADHFEYNTQDKKIKNQLTTKNHALVQATQGGLEKIQLDENKVKSSCLQDQQIIEVAEMVLFLESKLGLPQDCEWAYEGAQLYLLQTRPITSLPPQSFYDQKVLSQQPRLWDNSNIIESYSDVTSPLTFSFASMAYQQVYIQFCQVVGVPASLVSQSDEMFRNMLGLLRGRIYYNLVNWYKLVMMLPGSSTNNTFMETMMGVKKGLRQEDAGVFDFIQYAPRYGTWDKLKLTFLTLWRFLTIDQIIADFNKNFLFHYHQARSKNFKQLPFEELMLIYNSLRKEVLSQWKAPIINDYLCMIFFGLLKKLTEKWIAKNDEGASLQNDLLCGEGDLESTEPTKTLMRLAAAIDLGDTQFKHWFTQNTPELIWNTFAAGDYKEHASKFYDFLDKYGFRCINELKLEEPDLHDDPLFIIQSVQSYIRMKTYSVQAMEEREREIRKNAEQKIQSLLSGPKLWIYTWVLKQARRAVKNRENLRFARTKIFGVARHLFRAMGAKLVSLKVLNHESDIFYLTVEEILAYHEGRSITFQLAPVVKMRRKEYENYRQTSSPPERLMSYGPVGFSIEHLPLLLDGDLLKQEILESTDPNVLIGTPCSPGIVEGIVRVATNIKETQGLNGEILVTEKTDPGWVPLYPSCSGLLIERGSLLSHSAVVARELGLPTIVGIRGGLMKKLKTGMRVRVDAGRGEVRILDV